MVCNLNVRVLSNKVVFITPVTVHVHCELEGNVLRELGAMILVSDLNRYRLPIKEKKTLWTMDIRISRTFSDFSVIPDFYFISDLSDIWTLGHMDSWTF